MAKTLAQFGEEIRGYIAKGKLKAARKSLEKAQRAGHRGPQFKEIALELLLAEGGGAESARALTELAQAPAARLDGVLRVVEGHLRRTAGDHAVRDVLWELCLSTERFEQAIEHLRMLLSAGGIDAGARANQLRDRKDAVGATGIFLLATLGAVRTDRANRLRLVDRLLNHETGARLLAGVAERLHSSGHEDSELHYVLAKLAKLRGDRENFLRHAGMAYDEDPEGIWSNTMSDQAVTDKLEFALEKNSLRYMLQAATEARPEDIVELAKRSRGEGSAARALRGLALLLTAKVPNACRLLEQVATDDAAAAASLAEFLHARRSDWSGAAETYAAVVASGLFGDEARVASAADAILEVPAKERDEAWGRVAPRIVELAPARADVRRELGTFLIGNKDTEGAAKLLSSPDHIPIARSWAEKGKAARPVILAATSLAESQGTIEQHAEWLLKAARGDSELLAELGRRLGSSALSVDTALDTASTLLEQGRGQEAAEVMARLPLDEDTGQRVETVLRANRLLDDRTFQTVSFRNALALGDVNRARRLFKGVTMNVQALAEEAGGHAHPGRVLADVLISQEKGEIGVVLLDRRRDAGDDPRTLLPLADALMKASPTLTMGRLLRAKLLHAVGREADAVRDLRSIPENAAQADEAFRILGELAAGEAGGAAVLGRVDTLVARKRYAEAIRELGKCTASAPERLNRFETITREQPEMDAGHRGRAGCLLELGRIPESAEEQLRRFHCRDASPAAVATDCEAVARAALEADDIPTATKVLEALPDNVSDGAERAIGVIGEDKRAPMLILRSKLLLQLGRTEEAVGALVDLVAEDPPSRPQAAQALEAIVEAGQARPAADFALTDAYDAMGRTGQALSALVRLYEDDVTGKESVVQGARKLVVKADDPDVRLFLARVCLDMRDPAGATEHVVYARRLRPEGRRECVAILQRALDQDAFAPETHFALAEAHLAGDEADDAVRHFRAAVEVDRGRATMAIRNMEEAAPRSKRPALLWLAVGTTYAEFLRDHKSAVKSFTNGLDANPTAEMRVPLLLGRGDAYVALREDDRAFDDFDEAAHLDLLERRYYEFLRVRHRQRVLAAAESARAGADREFASAADACGRYIRLGRPEEAVEIAQRALAAAAGTDRELGPRYLVGVALHAAGRYDAAAQVLESVRSLATADAEIGRAARMLLAESYLDNGDRVSARACLTEIEAVNAAYPGLNARRGSLAPPSDDPNAPPPLLVRPQFPRPTE